MSSKSLIPENYHSDSYHKDTERRAIAVNAALEIAKAAAANASAVHLALKQTTDHISELADAIQAALEQEKLGK
ncbi:hypothetical protein [Pectobacterium aroidearum]|uniref:hypothetical protein n=1 Tax=Pectobacterium aroidearum TaxID=1201031 RepID=UPI002602569D|nr:hypothetical protein [Pectobacterium aroidearum]WKA63704.1 hypothetical protein QX495_06075 [Pectobacterium aroidearum]